MLFSDIKKLFSDSSKSNKDVVSQFQAVIDNDPRWVNHRCLLEDAFRGGDGETLLHLALDTDRLPVLEDLGIFPKQSLNAKVSVGSLFDSLYFERLLNKSYLSKTIVDRMNSERSASKYLGLALEWGGMTKDDLIRVSFVCRSIVTNPVSETEMLRRCHQVPITQLASQILWDSRITWDSFRGAVFFDGLSESEQELFLKEMPRFLRTESGEVFLSRSRTSLDMALDRLLVLKIKYDGPAYNDGTLVPYKKPVFISETPASSSETPASGSETPVSISGMPHFFSTTASVGTVDTNAVPSTVEETREPAVVTALTTAPNAQGDESASTAETEVSSHQCP